MSCHATRSERATPTIDQIVAATVKRNGERADLIEKLRKVVHDLWQDPLELRRRVSDLLDQHKHL